jgi:hypothetical protein
MSLHVEAVFQPVKKPIPHATQAARDLEDACLTITASSGQVRRAQNIRHSLTGVAKEGRNQVRASRGSRIDRTVWD